MAGDWIKVRSNIGTDPDVVDIAARVGLDEFAVVGRLHALWAWADQHSVDGLLPRATSAFVDRLAACPGFAEALRQVGWLEGRDSALRLPNWDRHNGNTAKTRSMESRKKQRQRDTDRDKCPDVCPPSTGTTPGPEKRREEKKDPPVEPSKIETAPPEAVARSEKFADWFRSTLPENVRLPDGWRKQWAAVFLEMIRLDKRTPEEIREVCQWARADEFWSAQFLSPAKLRKRKDGAQYFDIFLMKARASRGGGSGQTQPPRLPTSRELNER